MSNMGLLVLALAGAFLSILRSVRGLATIKSLQSNEGSRKIAFKHSMSNDNGDFLSHIDTASHTIIEVLGRNPKWSTFRTLLTAMPELTSTLENKDLILDTIYTVFVPTNSAFAKLEKDILFKIGKKDNLPILRKMVRHHFVDDVMSLDDMTKTDKIMTLALLEINVRPINVGGLGGLLGGGKNEEAAGGIRLNEGIITKPDIQCCNGVVHEVDSLLNPYLYYRYLV